MQIPIIDGIVETAAVSHPRNMLDAHNFAFLAVLGAAGSEHLAHAMLHPSHLVRHQFHQHQSPWLFVQPSYQCGYHKSSSSRSMWPHIMHGMTVAKAHGRALAQDSSAVPVLASVRVIPPYGPLTYAQLLLLLNDTSSEPGSGVSLTGIRSFSKIGLAGNGLCELGELPTAESPGKPNNTAAAYLPHAMKS